MTLQATPLRRIFARFFPKKAVSAALPKEAVEADFLPLEQKKELALRYLSEGEMALLQGNLRALPCFEAASSLDGQNPDIWFRQGLAFFEYGSEEGKEKALLLASKNFKTATQLKNHFFEAWVAWGNVLLQLGKFHEEHHFFIEAKNKYEVALSCSQDQNEESLAELYWDYGIACLEIASYSEEAIDVRLAIEAFQTSQKYQKDPSPEFWNDFGKAYLEMGLFINDSRLYLEAVKHFEKALEEFPNYFDGLMSLAEAYSQLYINTLDESYVTKASLAYQSSAKIFPRDADVWLGWGQILGESGRRTENPRLLRLSIEKCARAAQLRAKDPDIISQWVEGLSLLGMLTSRLDLMTEAEHKIIKATDQHPDDPILWHAYGICMIAFAKYYEDPDYYEIAIEKVQNGLSLDRSDPELWHALGLAHKYYAELTRDEDLMERASRFLIKAMDLKPACPALLFDTAEALFMQAEETGLIAYLEQSLSLFTMLLQGHKEAILRHPEWLYEYGRALEWLGDFTDEQKYFVHAIEVFSHVLLIDPDFPKIHSQLALCYVQLGHCCGEGQYYERAISFYKLAHRQDPENDQVLLDWGVSLINLAHHAFDSETMHQLYLDAEVKLTEAGKLGNEGAYYNLACLYSILGRVEESMGLIVQALSMRALPQLDELLDDDWLENLRSTSAFAEFFHALETKLQQTREE